MERKIRGTKIMCIAIALLFVGGASLTAISQGETIGQGDKTETVEMHIQTHVSTIYRGENGVADVYIDVHAFNEEGQSVSELPQPEKISITFLSEGKKVEALDFQQVKMHDNTVHIHLVDTPNCDRAAVTTLYPGKESNTRARIETLPSPTKVIQAETIAAHTETGVSPLFLWYNCVPPFPDASSSESGNADAHADKSNGDGGVDAWGSWNNGGVATSTMYNCDRDTAIQGMNGLGSWSAGIPIKNGASAIGGGVYPIGYAYYYIFEYDQDGDFVQGWRTTMWSISGAHSDIDADITGNNSVNWNGNHMYQGRIETEAYCPQPLSVGAPFIDLGEDYGDIDFEYINWFWLG
jgi:hypothetical protein